MGAGRGGLVVALFLFLACEAEFASGGLITNAAAPQQGVDEAEQAGDVSLLQVGTHVQAKVQDVTESMFTIVGLDPNSIPDWLRIVLTIIVGTILICALAYILVGLTVVFKGTSRVSRTESGKTLELTSMATMATKHEGQLPDDDETATMDHYGRVLKAAGKHEPEEMDQTKFGGHAPDLKLPEFLQKSKTGMKTIGPVDGKWLGTSGSEKLCPSFISVREHRYVYEQQQNTRAPIIHGAEIKDEQNKVLLTFNGGSKSRQYKMFRRHGFEFDMDKGPDWHFAKEKWIKREQAKQEKEIKALNDLYPVEDPKNQLQIDYDDLDGPEIKIEERARFSYKANQFYVMKYAKIVSTLKEKVVRNWNSTIKEKRVVREKPSKPTVLAALRKSKLAEHFGIRKYYINAGSSILSKQLYYCQQAARINLFDFVSRFSIPEILCFQQSDHMFAEDKLVATIYREEFQKGSAYANAKRREKEMRDHCDGSGDRYFLRVAAGVDPCFFFPVMHMLAWEEDMAMAKCMEEKLDWDKKRRKTTHSDMIHDLVKYREWLLKHGRKIHGTSNPRHGIRS